MMANGQGVTEALSMDGGMHTDKDQTEQEEMELNA